MRRRAQRLVRPQREALGLCLLAHRASPRLVRTPSHLAGQAMQREQRLRTTVDFRRVREHATRSLPHPLLVLFAAPNTAGQTRVGFTVARRVARSAVRRNRVRRRLAEAVRLRYPRLQPGYDLVLLARSGAVTSTWSELCDALDTVLKRARLWLDQPPAAPA